MTNVLRAWRCICGTLNEGTFGADGINDGTAYSICSGCRTECKRVENLYKLVPDSSSEDESKSETYRVVSQQWREGGWFNHVEFAGLSEPHAFGIAAGFSLQQPDVIYYVKLDTEDHYIIAVIVNGSVVWAPIWRKVL